MPKFEREDRYLVLKRKDIAATLTKTENEILDALLWKIEKYRINQGKQLLKCVVVESDWPEFEQVWAAIEKRMTPSEPVALEAARIDMAKDDIFTITQIARAVFADDAYTGNLDVRELDHILELALRRRIGLACRIASSVSIDLGNGHLLNCSLQKV